MENWIEGVINRPWEDTYRELNPSFVPASAFEESAWTGEDNVTTALDEVVFRDVRNQRVKIKKGYEGEGKYVDYWSKAKNLEVVKMKGGVGGGCEGDEEHMG